MWQPHQLSASHPTAFPGSRLRSRHDSGSNILFDDFAHVSRGRCLGEHRMRRWQNTRRSSRTDSLPWEFQTQKCVFPVLLHIHTEKAPHFLFQLFRFSLELMVPIAGEATNSRRLRWIRQFGQNEKCCWPAQGFLRTSQPPSPQPPPSPSSPSPPPSASPPPRTQVTTRQHEQYRNSPVSS